MNKYTKWPGRNTDKICVTYHSLKEEVKSHMHDFVEIAFIASGKCRHKYCKSEITLIKGDVFIISPNNNHSYILDNEAEVYNCLFYPSVLGDDWNSIKDIDSIFNMLMVEPFYRKESGTQKILHLSPSSFEQAYQYLKKILTASNKKFAGYKLEMKANLILYLIFLGKQWQREYLDYDQKIDDEKKDLILDAIAYMENNYLKDINIKKVASQIYLSPQYFSKLFKEETGLSPIKYINELRIKKAEKLLTETKYSISKISQLIGLNDVNYFSRLFKQQNKVSPSNFRKSNSL